MYDNDLILYILMRSDMKSMNPGKAMAQAAHAANHLVYKAGMDAVEQKRVNLWLGQAGGFGTTIVLDVGNEETLLKYMAKLTNLNETICGITLDPTYPLIDGDCLHLIPVSTCGYVFGYKNDLEPHLQGLSLYD